MKFQKKYKIEAPYCTLTKCPVTERPATKRTVTGRPFTGRRVTGRLDYQTSSVPNVKITVAIATHMLALGHSAVFVLLC